MTGASFIQIAVDHDLRTPLFQQIYEELKSRISSGILSAGTRLPSSRAFAQELGVSRSSVVNAYEQLMAEGYVESKAGSGVFVSNLPDLEVNAKTGRRTEANRSSDVAQETSLRPFYPGIPDMRLFPYEKWAQCVARVARNYPRELISVQSRFGDIRLRQSIAGHLAEWRGIQASPDRIVITPGSLGGMELVMRTMTKPGDFIGLEDPGYATFRKLALEAGMRPVWLRVDEQGAELPDMSGEEKPSLVVLTPSQQYPLGGTMPGGRRTEFLNYASRNDCWILEDDFDSEFRYSGKPVQSLAGLDGEGRVFYAGSFSKIFSVGLRLGYVVIPENLVDRFAAAMSRYSYAASAAPQRALAEFMESGEFHRHIRRMRRIYGMRRRLFTGLLSEAGNLLSFQDFQAGMQIAVYPAHWSDDVMLADELAQNGILCIPLSSFYADNPVHGLLMGYCSSDEDEIRAAMKIFLGLLERKSPARKGAGRSI